MMHVHVRQAQAQGMNKEAVREYGADMTEVRYVLALGALRGPGFALTCTFM